MTARPAGPWLRPRRRGSRGIGERIGPGSRSRGCGCSWTGVKARGSAAGHNGVKSIIERLGTQEFPRLRLGVGRGDGRRDLADHVLAKFEPDEQPELESFIAKAADAAEMFAVEGIEKVMNEYNPDATAPDVD